MRTATRQRTVQPYLGDAFDTTPEARVARVQTFVVCSTPRNVSGLLCRGLAETGVAGTPIEYFNPRWRSSLSRRWRCGSALSAYANELTARRTSGTGVFGTKLHSGQFADLYAEALGARSSKQTVPPPAVFIEQLLGGRPAYVHLVRRDIDRQATSFWVAKCTGVWAEPAAGGPRRRRWVRYSYAGIERCREHIVRGERYWQEFFRLNGIVPIEVTYEDLCAAYQAEMGRLLDRLVADRPANIAEPMTRRQADIRSGALLERFRRDRDRRSGD